MRTPPGDRKYLSEEELKRLFKAVESEPDSYLRARNRAVFLVMYWRGLRASEVGRLKLSSWREKTGRLYVERLKGSNAGEPLVSPAETRALNAWIRERGREPGPLFPSREGGKGIGRGMVFVLMRKYGAAADIPAFLRHPHCLKHSIATHLMGKLPVQQVQAWVGHADIRSTMEYAKLRSVEFDKAAEGIYSGE
jgi:integrase